MGEQVKEEIVIVGAGIIGVCTAYFLTKHPNFDPSRHHITIIEARRPASGASGKAGGLLALWAFPKQIVPLSFQLHQELSDLYNGEQEWGYRRVNTMSIQGTLRRKRTTDTPTSPKQGHPSTSSSISSLSSTTSTDSAAKAKKNATANPVSGPNSHMLPEGLDWIRPEVVDGWSSLGDTETTAQVHPYKFTMALLRRVLDSDSANLIIGKVTKLVRDAATGHATGVEYLSENGQNTHCLHADRLILTLGPWTSKILKKCPISGLRAHSITIKPSREASPYALFTEIRTARGSYVSPEIYPRREEVYVCGEGDTNVPLPDTTEDVQVEVDRCDDLFKYAGQISAELEAGKVLRKQACYLPVTDIAACSGPFIGETNVPKLYLASGHSCWGINNAPATGKLMSEIILEGRAVSASLEGLEPRHYFDASDFAC